MSKNASVANEVVGPTPCASTVRNSGSEPSGNSWLAWRNSGPGEPDYGGLRHHSG